MTNQILDGYHGYAIAAERKMLQLESEVARLREIIERAKAWTKNSFNEIELINILNEAKGEG